MFASAQVEPSSMHIQSMLHQMAAAQPKNSPLDGWLSSEQGFLLMPRGQEYGKTLSARQHIKKILSSLQLGPLGQHTISGSPLSLCI